MDRSRESWRSDAIKLGASAYLISTLVVLLLSLPVWAGQSEFPGHAHPGGAPDHVHNLNQVGLLSTAVPSGDIGIAVMEVIHSAPRCGGTSYALVTVVEGKRARAPPGPRSPVGTPLLSVPMGGRVA